MSATPSTPAFPFIHQLLAKAVAKRAATLPIPSLHTAVTQEYTRSAYITKVLEAPPSIREAVRNVAIANITQDPELEGQTQLVCILTMFKELSTTRKGEFIKAFKNVSTLAGQGPMFVALRTAYQGNHIPPHYEP